MDEMVESTRGRCPLILIAEMGGHFAAPTDPDNALFLAHHDYFVQLGRDNDHVYTVDWHGATADPDIRRYAANYYPGAVFNPQTGLYVSGDFIHPNTAGQRIALTMMCSSLEIPIPVEDSYLQLQNRIYRTSPLPEGTVVPFLDGSTARSGLSTAVGASVFSASSTVADTLPLIFSPETENLSALNDQVAASATSEKFGKFIDCPWLTTLQIFGQAAVGEKVTVTALVKPRQAYSFAGFIHPTSGSIYHGDVVIGSSTTAFTYSENEPPVWMTFEYVRGPESHVTFVGRLFSLSVTRTHGQPVATFLPQVPTVGTFQTLPSMPHTLFSETLRATANPLYSGAMSLSFSYGTDPNLVGAEQTPSTTIADGGTDVLVTNEVGGLSPGTTYFYRAAATFSGNPQPVLGEIRSFKILPDAENPVVVAPLANGHILVAMFGVPGGSYTLEASADLQTWVSLGTVTPGPNGIATYEDPNNESLPSRFYRMRYAAPAAPAH
jgi:hypothetical protein